MQAECQCRATSGNFSNCIVFSKLRGDRAAWTSGDSRGSGGPVPPGWWFSARVGDHNLAIRIWRSRIRQSSTLQFTRLRCRRRRFWRGGNAVGCARSRATPRVSILESPANDGSILEGVGAVHNCTRWWEIIDLCTKFGRERLSSRLSSVRCLPTRHLSGHENLKSL